MHANAAGETKAKESSGCDPMVLFATCVRDDFVDILAHGRVSSGVKCVVGRSFGGNWVSDGLKYRKSALQKQYVRMRWQGYKALFRRLRPTVTHVD